MSTLKKAKEVTILPLGGPIQPVYVERDLPPEIQGGVWQVLYLEGSRLCPW